jgi:hypothetical protein
MSNYRFVKVQGQFDIRKNFWEENFQISLIYPFSSLYQRDNTTNKLTSSKILWCCWLDQDPNYENKLYRLPPDQKKSAILAYYPEFDYKDPLIAECLMAYPEHCLSPAAKSFRSEEETLRKFAELIEKKIEEDELTFDSYIPLGNNRFQLIKGTANQIADLKKKNAGLYPQYEKIRKMFEQEQNEIRVYGGGTETIMESGGLILFDED